MGSHVNDLFKWLQKLNMLLTHSSPTSDRLMPSMITLHKGNILATFAPVLWTHLHLLASLVHLLAHTPLTHLHHLVILHSPSPTPSQSKSDVHSGTTPTQTPAHNHSASLPPIKAAVHDLLLAVQHSTKSATLPSTSINTTIDLTQDAGNDVDEMMPSSSHAAWPLKFVKSMSEGFLKMEMMTGSLEYRFAIAFPSARTDKFPKASYNINSRIWEWAPEDLCNQYITAGYFNGG